MGSTVSKFPFNDSRIRARQSSAAGPRTGIGWKLQLFVFFAAAAVIVSRRPDALFNPQFFAEDGTFWYPAAYMSGWLSPLFHSKNGYFQTLPRLVADLAVLVPFRFAPLLMNVIGIALQVLPVNILLSSRCRNWAPVGVRAFMGIIYLALPNTMELDAAIEEGQWHLALLASIVVLACRPLTLAWRIFDITVILLCGLSGPFGILLLPVALIFWWLRRERWRLMAVAILALSATLQLSAILRTAEATRPHVGLGATPKLFIELLAGQVYLGALLGQNSLLTYNSMALLTAVAIVGTATIIYCLVKAPLEWKLFVSFCALVFAASLRNPMVSMTLPQWGVLKEAAGIRYWFFPMLAFAWALIWCALLSRPMLIRIVAAASLIVMYVGITRDWRYPPYPDFHFPEYAEKFASAPPGTVVTIPIYPKGWVMRLTKK